MVFYMKQNRVIILVLIVLVSSRLLVKDNLFSQKKNDDYLLKDNIVTQTINDQGNNDSSEEKVEEIKSETKLEKEEIIEKELINETIREVPKEEINTETVLEKEEIIKEEPIVEDATDKKEVSNDETNLNKPAEEVKNSNQEDIKIDDVNNKEEVETNHILKTIKEQNQDLINEIKTIYGYNVSYGDEDFWYNGTLSTKLTDEEKANESLKKLKDASNIFPTDFFRTFQGYNGFRIILFEHINGAAGVASYEFGDDNFIALDVSNDFLGRVFYHETFHIMEKYISYKTYGQPFPFANWSSLNPTDFNYGDTGIKYTAYDLNDFYRYTSPSLIAFVSEYAKSSEVEDRAELFADLMFRGIKKEYMKNGFAINEKAKTMALILRNYFANSNGARWEKYIEW